MVHQPVYFERDWMESKMTIDSAINDQMSRISTRIPTPNLDQKQQTVCVLVHGFSASSFEFDAFKQSLLSRDPQLLFSTIVLGGHGRDYEAFKRATYQDWLVPIRDEVQQLTQQGFQDIILFGVSTGAAGILQMALQDAFKDMPIRRMIFMDPYVLPTNKTLYLVPFLKYIVSNTRLEDADPLGTRHWYTNRPTSALHELLKLVKSVQYNLSNYGALSLPKISIYTADNDPTADTKGAQMVLDALGSDIVDIQRYASNRHVIIEPQSKQDWGMLIRCIMIVLPMRFII